MQNLAGHSQATDIATRELERCGIPVQPFTPTGEVQAYVYGVLGEFTFHRAWYYWMIRGLMPLEEAQKLYDHPVGKTDIRVCGHCMCPAPEGYYITWYCPDGHQAVATKNEADFARVFKGEEYDKIVAKYVFSDNPEAIATPFVTSYHIDSELGLYLFADVVHKLPVSGIHPLT